MANWKCNACGGTYSDTQRDGSIYRHACGPEIVERETFDDKGNIVKPRVERVRENRRDENITPSLTWEHEANGYFTHLPEDPATKIFRSGPVPIKSEGGGRTAL